MDHHKGITSTTNMKSKYLDEKFTDEAPINIPYTSLKEEQFVDQYPVENSLEPSENTCKICGITFSNVEEIENHYKSRRLAYKRYKCCACDKTFRDNSSLNVHGRRHTGEQPFACNECGKKFSINGNLVKHVRIHKGEKRFECDICTKKFMQYAHLQDHMETHAGEKLFSCTQCESSFKTQARLMKHRRSHRAREKKVKRRKRYYQCPVCLESVRGPNYLLLHLENKHKGHESFSCATCKETYKDVNELQNHYRLNHTPFVCVCGKTFTCGSYLRRHQNTHKGLKPYNCQMCDKSFPSTQNLNRHMLTHTGEKPFKCDECKKAFMSSENLNRHKRVHTGEKPYSCDICGKCFAHSTTVKEHRQTHTGAKPFVCKFCQKSFAISKLMYKHVRVKHPEEFDDFKVMHMMPRNLKIALRQGIKGETFSDEPEFSEATEFEGECNNDVVQECKEEIFIKEEVLIKEELIDD